MKKDSNEEIIDLDCLEKLDKEDKAFLRFLLLGSFKKNIDLGEITVEALSVKLNISTEQILRTFELYELYEKSKSKSDV